MFRLLKQRLDVLRHQRVRRNKMPGMDEVRRFGNLPRRATYQKAVDSVREVLVQLAPELFQDLAHPWSGALSAIEATQIIKDQEDSAVRRRPKVPMPCR